MGGITLALQEPNCLIAAETRGEKKRVSGPGPKNAGGAKLCTAKFELAGCRRAPRRSRAEKGGKFCQRGSKLPIRSLYRDRFEKGTTSSRKNGSKGKTRKEDPCFRRTFDSIVGGRDGSLLNKEGLIEVKETRDVPLFEREKTRRKEKRGSSGKQDSNTERALAKIGPKRNPSRRGGISPLAERRPMKQHGGGDITEAQHGVWCTRKDEEEEEGED